MTRRADRPARLRARPARATTASTTSTSSCPPATRTSPSAPTRPGRRRPAPCAEVARGVRAATWCPTRAAPRSTVRRSPCRPGTRSAAPGRCRPSSSTSTCRERFDLEYQAADGTRQRPVMIHRALFGSIERFFAVLTEHYAGAFPPVAGPGAGRRHPGRRRPRRPPATRSSRGCARRGSGSEVDASDDRMQKKIRTHTKQKVPFLLIAGDDDVAAGAVSFRYRDGRAGQRRPGRRGGGAGRRTPCATASRSERHGRQAVAAGGGRTRRRAGHMAGEPDAFERLWTPHRMVYIAGEDKPADDAAGGSARSAGRPGWPTTRGSSSPAASASSRCSTCTRTTPATSWSAPTGTWPTTPTSTAAETAEVAAITQSAMRVLRRRLGPHGFNLGMNQGPVAGAGIAAHLHQHVVPRWGGDANFLPIVARTKALPGAARRHPRSCSPRRGRGAR